MARDINGFRFEQPDWRMVPDTNSHGDTILGETGVQEISKDSEYWKCFQRYRQDDGQIRVKVLVFSVDAKEVEEVESPNSVSVHFDQTSGLDVPPEIWNQLIIQARQDGVLSGSN